MGEIDLQERFPDMKPISRPPSLGRVNGIGFGIYGHRDDDPETGTYVTTLAFSFLWIPLLALGAYRVAPADGGGWYFLGKVPLSSIAKLCNILVLLACVSFGSRIAWKSYQDRPEVRAANQMARADELVEDGKLGDAAKLYRELARGSSAQAVPARTALHALVRDRLITASDADALRVVKAAIAVQRKSPSKELEGVRGEVAAAAEQRAAKDPAGALRLLQAVEDFGTPTEAETALHHKILELLVAGEPTNLDYCAALAGLCEAANELDRCRALLEPLRDRLGGSEGARILGQLEVQEGNLEAALALLSAYVTPRLKTLHSAQSEYDAAWTAVGEEALARLNRDLGPPRFYRDYERANEAEKQRLVEAELEKAREGNWELEQALDAWRDAASVVPAALDLGLVHLRLGQQAADPAERERQLKTAERVFLATRAVSGESDEYRMFLGQVYYWLGRAEEGEKLFAELLKTHERAPGLLVQLCSVMRQLGAFHKAVELAEEAFGNQPPGAERQNTAYLLAMTVSDEEKKIMWLEQADPENVGVRAALSFSKGVIAHDKGNRDEATRLLREAVDAYAAMPADVGSLHNGAVACLRLGSLEFDPKLVDRAIDMLERAHRLNPDSAITMNMLASGHWERALGQLVSSKLDLKALQLRPNQAMCSMMYADPRGRDAFAAKLAAHRDTHRARVLLQQARAIAPKNVSLTTTAFEVEGRVLDVGAMRKICDDVARVRPDLGQSRASILERYTDDARKKSRESTLRDIARQRAVLAGLPEGGDP